MGKFSNILLGNRSLGKLKRWNIKMDVEKQGVKT
jgi:hypothetical protein